MDCAEVGEDADKERIKEMCVKYVLQQAQLARIKLGWEQAREQRELTSVKEQVNAPDAGAAPDEK